MEEKFTVKQVIMMTRDMLRNIGTIPVEEAEHIGVPVAHAIMNLTECIKAFNADERRIVEEESAKQTDVEDKDGNADSE